MKYSYAPKHVFYTNAIKLSLAFGLVSAGLVLTTPSWADAKLSIPETMVIESIDGQEAGHLGSFSRKHRVYSLPAGDHVITARYDQLFHRTNYDGDNIIKSNGVTIKTSLADQQSYSLAWLSEPQTSDEARAFVKRPTLLLKSSSGEIITSQKGAITPDHPN